MTTTLQRNEKTKAWSTIVVNLGTALFAAAFGRLWLSGFDVWVPMWLLAGAAVMAVGVHLLDWLETEV